MNISVTMEEFVYMIRVEERARTLCDLLAKADLANVSRFTIYDILMEGLREKNDLKGEENEPV